MMCVRSTKTHQLHREQLVAAPLEAVFEFFSRASNLEAITPPWLRFRVVTPEPVQMRRGTLIEYRLRLRGVPLRWVSLIEEWEPGVRFVDRQLTGPYQLWHHTHEFSDRQAAGTLVRDTVRYAIPFGPLGELAHATFVEADLRKVFDYRQRAVASLMTG
jgi:ligand-binding SRPBCC domain-containing protein